MKVFLSAFADEAGSSFDDQLAALKRNRLSYVELRRLDGKNISELTDTEAVAYATRLKNAGIKVWSLGSPLAKNFCRTGFEAQKMKAERLCRLAEIFETDNVRAFSFVTFAPSFDRKIIMERLAPLVETLDKAGINYCLENDSGLYASTVDRVEDVLSQFPQMKYIYDPANFLMCGQDPEKSISALADRAYYFHIKDVTGKKIVPAGCGNGRIAEIMKGLEQDKFCTVEPHLLVFRGLKGYDFSQYNLKSAGGRFDCAVDSFRKLLSENGFADCGAYFER